MKYSGRPSGLLVFTGDTVNPWPWVNTRWRLSQVRAAACRPELSISRAVMITCCWGRPWGPIA